jgi:uncharacterized protein YtpQ (UPF0354 family)
MKKAKHTPTTNTPEHTGARMPVLTPAQFTQEVASELQRLGPHRNFQIVEDLEIKGTISHKYPGEISLQNAYRDYLHSPDQKAVIIAHWVSALLEAWNIKKDAAIDSSRVLPVLEHNSRLRGKTEKATSVGADPGEYAHQRFTEDLIIQYVVDAPKFMLHLTNQHLADLNVSVEELHKIAVTNLIQMLPAPAILEAGGFYRIQTDNNYEASLVFLDDIWDKFPFNVPGEIVVAVPARDSLLVTGSKVPNGVRILSKLAQEVYGNSSYPISSELLIRREGKFVQYGARHSSK